LISKTRQGSSHTAFAARFTDQRATLLGAIGSAAATFGALFGGLDTSFGNSVAGIVTSLVVAIAVWLVRPSVQTWRKLVPVAFPLTAAWLWGLAVSVGSFGAPAMVPDLLNGELLGLLAAGGLWLTGALTSVFERARLHSIEWLVAIAALIAAIGLIASSTDVTLNDTLWQPGQRGRFAGTLGNANVAATFYGALAILTFGQLLSRKFASHRPRPMVLALRSVALATLVVACFATGSRTGAAAMLAAGAILIIHSLASSRWRARAILVGTSAIALVAALAVVAAPLTLTRFSAIDADWQTRLTIWRHGARLASASPWLGHGLGSFAIVSQQALTTPGVANALWPVNAAHNTVLQLLIEGGVPFAALIAFAVVIVIGRAAGTVSRDGDHMKLSILLAVCIILANASVDIALNVPATVLLFWYLLGLLWDAGGEIRGVRLRLGSGSTAA
jgi:O-antigen ligase